MSRMRRFRMVDMCKGKRKLWIQGTDDVLVVGLHMVGKEWKFHLSTTWHPSLHFFFFSFTWFIPLISLLLPLLFSFFLLFLSFFRSHIFFLFLYFSIYIFFFFLSFFSILILFSLFFPLLRTFQSSQVLSFSHAYNLKF
jgi:hypothetical protein